MNSRPPTITYIWLSLFFITIFSFLGLIIILIIFFWDNYIFWMIFLGIHWISLVFLLIHFQLSKYFLEYKFVWIFIVSFFPWLGIFVYLLIGNYLGFKKIGKRYKKLEKKYLELESSINNEIIINNKNLPRKIKEIFKFSTYISKHSVYVNIKMNLLIEPLDKFENLKIDLENAKKYIYINYFIIRKGNCLDFISEILIKKLKEGVKVRIIFDFLGTFFSTSLSNFYRLRKYGAKIKIYGNHFPIRPIVLYRNHRKDVIIDGKVAYTGGYNIGDEYCHMSTMYGIWNDTHIRVVDHLAKSIEYVFLKDWEFITKKEIKLFSIEKQKNITYDSKFDNIVQVIDDGPQIETSTTRDLFIHLISKAQKRIWIITPYLLLDEAFEKALISAANTGIDVKIIIPEYVASYVLAIMRLKYCKLIKANIKIYEYISSYIHSKVILIDDDICTVGTTNLDYCSFYTCSQTTLLIYSKKICLEMQKNIFERDFKNSKLMKIDVMKKYNKFHKFFIKLTELMSVFV